MLMVAALNHRAQLQGCNLPDWRVILPYVKRLEFWNEHSWPVEYLIPDPPDSLEFPPQHELYGPLLHLPTFEKQISEGLHLRESAFSAVVLAVCALGAQILSPVPSKDKSRERWFNQIRLERFVFSPKLELCHLQLYCKALYTKFCPEGSWP
ncbi:hypothetical protein K435DRAFT_851284 [Dendrothele bispora CBS 962.96]|uniref:Xylanolytic transcriptional activator regulatory domain-containing protein n=1 Tax=Dendrothele bispora (strain CBS 962.96) TaxID=1314807 RepID=A0A4S8MN18_DENBC|nr:hypothetical protein K435DRAFT_851284 [Dendrothele bispora CBS 962.96]